MKAYILNDWQRKITEKNYHLVEQIMRELQLNENDIEDWHGYFSEVLCKYVTLIPRGEEITSDKITAAIKNAYMYQCNHPISVTSYPIGLMGL